MRDDVRIRPNLPRLMFGLAVILAGVLFTLDSLHIIETESYLAYWPIALIFIGLANLAQSATTGGRVWGAILAIAGVWILGENLGYVSLSVWTLSPLLLVVLGVAIIWRGWRGPVAAVLTSDAGSQLSAAGDRRFIKGTVVMGGFESSSDAADFRGGDLMMIMAGGKIDLRQAAINGHEAVIDVLVIMGGIELRVPETWQVESRVLPMLGGVTNHARANAASPQRLVLVGNVFMGGVEIKN